jgi:hypothetical protein
MARISVEGLWSSLWKKGALVHRGSAPADVRGTIHRVIHKIVPRFGLSNGHDIGAGATFSASLFSGFLKRSSTEHASLDRYNQTYKPLK